ncbi:UNVERIFIED_CONTAM: F-box protein CPR1 [Sesamum calycinum]|uniref:F-box protein CPR1 n=1 Tax=Sesamum calycinum TaxID=2727403 RepID=A0AAW2LTA5_9LAMI
MTPSTQDPASRATPFGRYCHVWTRLVRVPESPLALKRPESFSMDGFGYDRSSDDYKGCWRRVGSSPYDHAIPERSPIYALHKYALSSGAFVNGALHWLARSRKLGSPSVIVAFNLANEVFDEIPAPSGVDVQNFVFNKLVVLGGFLCMIDGGEDGPIDVWTMKEYGLKQSWTKFRIQVDYKWHIFKPLCFISDEEVVLVTRGETLVVYNQTNGTLSELVATLIAPGSAIDGCSFVESLVCPAALMGPKSDY